MKKPITLDDAVGKKLTGHSFGHDENVLLVFEDSYVVIAVERNYHEENVCLRDRETAPENLRSFDLVKLGILTHEENDVMAADKKARAEAGHIERMMYERLKLKFENESSEAKPLGGATLVFPNP